ncbi:MAG: hypothetical protein KKG00_07460 [Bacteroidetes bacterium]|nr:hypothetical protein [Bacteroidota bacterium]
MGILAICLLAYPLYRIYNKYCSITLKIVTVELRPNRSALLAEQKKVVNARRKAIRGESTDGKSAQTEPYDEESPEPVEPMDAGFGEDLGLAIGQSQESSANTLVRRRSRFADMKSAAEELKDIYNRNSKIE